MKRILAVVAAVLMATLPHPGRAAEPFEIYAIEPLTGVGAFLGKQQQIAMSVLEDMVNKSGGIRGRPIKFVVEDDQSNPQTALQLFNEILSHKPAVVIGGAIAATCNALIPLVKNGPVLYCMSPGAHPVTGSYVYSANVTTQDFLAGAAVFARGEGWTKVAAITSTDSTGQDADRSLDATFNAQNGVQIITHEHYNNNDVSVAAQLAHVQSSGAQALIVWSSGSPVATVLRGVQSAGMQIPLILGAANLTYAQMKAYAGLVPPTAYFPTNAAFGANQLPNGPLKRKINDFFNAFKSVGVRPDEATATPWDAFGIVLDAYRKLGFDASAAQMHGYLDNLHGWVGIHGTYDFRAIPQRGVGGTDVLMVRWDPAKDTWVGVSALGGKPQP